jgi:hypothetical protein
VVDVDNAPKRIFHAFVSVFNNCKDVPGLIFGVALALLLPFGYIETPETLKSIVFVPKFTRVINVPIGNATDAFVGIVMVCAPVLAE